MRGVPRAARRDFERGGKVDIERQQTGAADDDLLEVVGGIIVKAGAQSKAGAERGSYHARHAWLHR